MAKDNHKSSFHDDRNLSDEQKKFIAKIFFYNQRKGIQNEKETEAWNILKEKYSTDKSIPLDDKEWELIRKKEWEKLSRSLQLENVEDVPFFQKRNKPGSPAKWAVSAVAAAFLVLLTLNLPHVKNGTMSPENGPAKEMTVASRFTSDHNIKKITLPDGSMVFMNTNSSISLQKGKFNASTREVWLEEGEAFFDIRRDENRPFIVHTRDGLRTQVLGTSFNIKSYKELNNQVITVRTGRVQVTNGDSNETVVIDPDYQVSFDRENQRLVSQKTDGEHAAAWRDGTIVMDNVPFAEIAFRLKQYYKTELINNASLDEDATVYVSFRLDMPLETVVKTIASIYKTNYQIKGRNVELHQ